VDLLLQGKSVLITGGSAGIGLGMAKAFAAEGCSLVLVARSEPALTRAAQDIAAAHQVSVQVHACDIGDDRTAPALCEKYSHIDILVNNAGAIPGGALEDVPQARWREGWELKVFGFINMSRAFYQVMAARRHGVILNMIGASATGPDDKYIAGSTGNLPKVDNVDIQYGQSAVFSPSDFAFPHDAIMAETTPNTEMTLIVDVDLEKLQELQNEGSVRNYLDRRRDLYQIKWTGE